MHCHGVAGLVGGFRGNNCAGITISRHAHLCASHGWKREDSEACVCAAMFRHMLECEKLKNMEDKWMCRLGTLNTNRFGLNSRDEIVSRARVNVRLNRDGGV